MSLGKVPAQEILDLANDLEAKANTITSINDFSYGVQYGLKQAAERLRELVV